MRSVLLVCLSIVVFFVGCDTKPDTCKEQSAWQLRIGFYSAKLVGNIQTSKDTVLRSFTARLIIQPDSVLGRSLPLRQNADTSVYSILINGKLSASFYAVYKRELAFENYTCGFRTNFLLDTVYTIPKICDSITIVQPNITDVYQENCRFYFNGDTVKSK